MSKENKLRIIRAICFVLVTYLVLFIIGSLLQPKNKEDYASFRSTQMKYIFDEKEDSLDLLVVGHSGVLFGFSPMELYESYGITSYNCARTSLSPKERYDLLNEVLKTQSPKVIILNMDAFFHDTAIGKMAFVLNGNFGKVLPIFNNHSRWRNYLPGDDQVEERSITKNHIVVKDVAPYKGKEKMKHSEKRRKMVKNYKKYLDQIYLLCEEKGIELVLMELPSTIYWERTRHNTAADYAKEKGLDFIDFNLIKEEIGFDWKKHTVDKGDHLNEEGARIVTNYIGDYLVKNYGLINHRGDAEYSLWEEDLVKYKKRYFEE